MSAFAIESEQSFDRCCHRLFEDQVERAPDRVALIDRDGVLTYRELNASANRIAHRLRALGVRPESIVALHCDRSMGFALGALGIMKSGGAYLALDVTWPADRIERVLRNARVKLLLHDNRLPAIAFEGIASIRIGRLRDEAGPGMTHNPLPVAHGENLAYVVYTSGSTGEPKGIMVAHEPLRNYLEWAADRYLDCDELGTALFTSLACDLSVTSAFVGFLRGRSLTLFPGSVAEATLQIVNALEHGQGFGFLKLTPSHLNLIVRWLAPGGGEPGCRMLVVGGEQLAGDLCRKWFDLAPRSRIINEYGPAEAVVGCCVYEHGPHQSVGSCVPIGQSIDGATLDVCDRRSERVPTGTEGELIIGGRSLARGYLADPALTSARFLPGRSGARAGTRCYRSGDVVVERADRNLEFKRRNDEQVKVLGFRVEPREVESVLRSHGQVSDAVVRPLDDGHPASCLVAYVVLREVAADEPADVWQSRLDRYLAERLPQYMIPAKFVRTEAITVRESGKLDAEALSSPIGPSGIKTTAQVEQLLIDIFTEVLGARPADLDENFFAAGGDSMRCIQAAFRAKRRGIVLTVQDFFECQTIRSLAAKAASTTPSTGPAPAAVPFQLIPASIAALLPAGIEDAYPLSKLQMGTLFHSQLEENSGIYHNLNSYHLEADFSEPRLHEVIGRIIARHEILRTSYNLADYEQPLQLVHRQAPTPLFVVDWRAFSQAEQEKHLADWLERESATPFDWQAAPLARFFVHRRSEESFQFTVSKHHSILDGWSAASLLAEIFHEYLACLRGDEAPRCVAPKTRYRDFVALEQATLDDIASRKFWQDKLQKSPGRQLPSRAPGPTLCADTPKSRIKTRKVPIGDELADQLAAAAKSLSVPLRTLLLTAHLKVLRLLYGTPDVTTGVVTNCRPEEADADRTLGLFLNTLPFRMRLVDSATWREEVGRTFDTENTLLPHRRYPLAQLIKDQGGAPLFDSVFYYTHFRLLRDFKDTPHVRCLDFVAFEETEMPLTTAFNVHPITNAIVLNLHCHTGTVSQAQLDLLVHYYQRTLAALVDLDVPSHAVRHTLAIHNHQVCFEWNDTDAPQAGEYVHESFERRVDGSPDSVALVQGELQLTYGFLEEHANRLAAAMRGAGVKPGEPIAILEGRSPQMIVAQLAVLKAGCGFVPIGTDCAEERLDAMIRAAELSVAVGACETPRQLRARFKHWIALDEVVGTRVSSARTASARRVPLVHPEALAYLMFTSGSTGTPKGVMISHRNLANSTSSRFRYYKPSVNRFLLVSPCTVDSSIAGIYWTLCQGGTLILPEADEHQDPRYLVGLMSRHEVSHVLCIPSLYRLLLRQDDACAFRTLSAAIVAGEECTASLVNAHYQRAKSTPLYNEYGPTEGTVWATVHRTRPLDEEERVTIGRPVANVQAFVFDALHAPAPPGTVGEIHLAGSGLARGYAGNPALTAEAFLPCANGKRLYRTGDRASYGWKGEISWLGRVDRQVKVRGHRVELAETEQALRMVLGVEDAVVVARAGELGGTQLAGYGVLAEAAPAGLRDLAGVNDLLRRRVAASALLQSWTVLGALPRMSNGKVDRAAISKIPPTGRVGARVPPRNPVEQVVATIFRQILGTGAVSVDDDFFNLGGDSLTATQIVARLEQALKIEVSLRSLFDFPSVSGLSEQIVRSCRDSPSDVTEAASVWMSGQEPSLDRETRDVDESCPRQWKLNE